MRRTVPVLATMAVGVVLLASGAASAYEPAPVPEPTKKCDRSGGPCVGTDRRDAIYGSKVADDIRARAGQDWAFPRAGNDTVYGGTDTDHLLDGRGRDDLHGGAGRDWLAGDEGTTPSTAVLETTASGAQARARTASTEATATTISTFLSTMTGRKTDSTAGRATTRTSSRALWTPPTASPRAARCPGTPTSPPCRRGSFGTSSQSGIIHPTERNARSTHSGEQGQKEGPRR